MQAMQKMQAHTYAKDAGHSNPPSSQTTPINQEQLSTAVSSKEDKRNAKGSDKIDLQPNWESFQPLHRCEENMEAQA